MRTRTASILTLALLAGQCPAAPLFAAADCGEKLANIPGDRIVTVYLEDGARLQGAFEVNPERSILACTEGKPIPFDDVAKVTWKQGHADGRWMLIGTFGGLALGATAGALASRNASHGAFDLSRFFIMAGCLAGGAVAGLLAGTIVPLVPHEHSIECAREVQ